jgi:hypothetical protein
MSMGNWLSFSACVVLATLSLACLMHIYQASRSDSSGCVMTFMMPIYHPIHDSVLQHPRYTLERYEEGSARAGAAQQQGAALTQTMNFGRIHLSPHWPLRASDSASVHDRHVVHTDFEWPLRALIGWLRNFARDSGCAGEKSVPAIFVPGNGGSKAQGRSIAAEAARQAARARAVMRLAFYVVHLDGQLSAMDASILQAQAAYVQTCVSWMASRSPSPTSLFLVGHSMGASLPLILDAADMAYLARFAAIGQSDVFHLRALL